MPARNSSRRSIAVLLFALVLAGCSGSPTTSPATTPAGTPSTDVASSPDVGTELPTPEGETTEQAHPDVVEVELTRTGDTWSVAATISSPYDTPERYADAFRVLAPDGSELGVRELLHDHAAEQPFTRSLDGVEIPADVTEVTVEGRDLVNGWGGATVTVDVPR